MSRKKKDLYDPTVQTPWDSLIQEVEAANGIPTGLMKHMLWKESRFNPEAVSPAKAKGIAQFMPKTAKAYGLNDRLNPEESIKAMGAYLKDLGKQYKGDFLAAVAHYNGGTRQGKMVANGQKASLAETADYVKEFIPTIKGGSPAGSQVPKADLAYLTPAVENPERFSPQGGAGNLYGVSPAAEREKQRVAAQQASEQRYGGLSGIGNRVSDAFQLNNSYVASEDTYATPREWDKNWKPSPEDIQTDTDQFGREGAQWLQKTALNADHYEHLREVQGKRKEMLDSQAHQNGFVSFALNAAAIMTSPETLVTLPLGGVAGGATKANSVWNTSRAARMVDVGVTQGLLNVGGDVVIENLTGQEADTAMSFGVGAALGGLAGAFAKPPRDTLSQGFRKELDTFADKMDVELTAKSLEENGVEFTEKGSELLGRNSGLKEAPRGEIIDEPTDFIGTSPSSRTDAEEELDEVMLDTPADQHNYNSPLSRTERRIEEARSHGRIDAERKRIEAVVAAMPDKAMADRFKTLAIQGKVQVLNDLSDIGSRSRAVLNGAAEIDPNAKAVYIPQDDTVYLNLKQVNLKEDNLEGLMLHEIGVHMGLERYLGSEKALAFMDSFSSLRNKDKAVAEAFARAERVGTQKHVLTEEALGYFIEATAKRGRHPIAKQLIAVIRDWLRKRGWNMQLSQTDIEYLLRKSVENMANNPHQGFNMTFPNVWHGSHKRFDGELDTRFMGSGEGQQSYMKGHYVSDTKAVGLNYRNRETAKRGLQETDGGLYRLRLTAESPDQFLVWDAIQQPAYIEARLADIRKSLPNGDKMNGKAIARALEKRFGDNEAGRQAAANFMWAQGIHGVRIPRRDSFGDELGTNNYVVFNNAGVERVALYSKNDPLTSTPEELLVEAGNSKAALSAFRWDVDARLNGSPVMAMRKLASKLIPSPAGKENKLEVQKTTAQDTTEILRESWDMDLNRAMANHWTKLVEQDGLPARWRSMKQHEAFEAWSEDVFNYIQDRRPDAANHYDATVAGMGEDIRKLFASITEYVNDPMKSLGKTGELGLMDSKLEVNPNYIPKIPNVGKVRDLIQRSGSYDEALTNFTELVYQSRKALGTEKLLDENHAHRLFVAEAEYKAATRNKTNPEPFNPSSVPRVPEGLDAEMYADMLAKSDAVGYAKIWMESNGANIGKVDYDSVTRNVGNKNLRHRLDMDDTTTIKLKDGTELGWKDITERNFQTVIKSYTNRMAGRVALAAHVGVRADEDWAKVVKEIREEALSKNIGVDGYTSADLDKEMEFLQFGYETLMGIPQHAPSKADMFLRTLRDVIFARVGGLFAVNQIAEFSSMMGRYGFGVVTKAIPSYNKFLVDAKTGKIPMEEAHQLSMMIGDLGDDLKYLTFGSRTEWVDNFGDTWLNSMMDKVASVGRSASYGVSRFSGFAHLNAMMRRGSYLHGHSMTMQRVLNGDASKVGIFTDEQLAYAGLSPERYSEMTKAMQPYVKADANGLFEKFDWEGFQKSYPELHSDYVTFIKRNGDTALQRNSLSSSHPFYGTVLGKVVMQFRNFLAHAYTKQTMRSLHYRDSIAAATFLYSTLLTAVIWPARVTLQSLGREDAQEYRDRMLSPEIFSKTVLSRLPQMSLIPTFVDSVSPWGAIFEGHGRTSVSGGTDALNFITGNPTFDYINNLTGAAKGAINAVTNSEYQLDDGYAKRTAGLMFGSNLPYMIPALNAFSELFPETSTQEDE